MPTYAEFKSHTFAQKALRRLQSRVGEDGRVQVLDGLSHHTMPLRLTAAGIGMLIGGIFLAVLAAAAVGLAWLVGFPMIAATETLALAVGLAALFGALAGGLSFASDNGKLALRLREWLNDGNAVVVVQDRRGHEDTLRICGAVRTYNTR